MAALRATAEAEGGVVVNVAGDGFFAIFGVPIALPEAPLNAVRAADRMTRLVAARNAEADVIPVPDVHIGIASGEVLVSPSPDTPGWSVLGNAINLASRLCDAAGPAETLVDQATSQLVGPNALWTEERNLAVKGRSGPTTARVLSTTVSAGDGSVSKLPFVGRESALAELDTHWARAITARRSHAVVLEGEAGIGKTALVRHWLAQAPGRPYVWHRCGSGVSSPSLVGLLQSLAHEVPSAADALDELLQSASGPNMATDLRVDPLPQLVAFARVQISEIAARSPFVLVIDDVHAADEEIVEIVETLASHPAEGACLIVTVQRGDDLRRANVDSTIRVGALDDDSLARLLSAALGMPPSPDLGRALQSRAQGHPLMALQSAAYLREADLVTVIDGQLQLTDSGAIEDLPSSLRLFISARIDRLPAPEREDLRHLSALGDEWTTAWVARVLGASSARRLPALATRGLIEESSRDAWRFAHGLVQATAYASLTRRDRAALHKRQLQMIDDSATLEARAHHALAWASATPVSDNAEHRASTVTAAATTLEFARQLYSTGARGTQAVIRRAWGVLDDIEELAADLAVELQLLAANCLIELGNFDTALQASGTALSATERANLPPTVRARCLLVRGHALSRLRRYEGARQSLDDAVAIAEREGDGAIKARALRLMAITWRHSLIGRMNQLVEEAYEAFSAIGDDQGAAECARELAYIHSLKPHLFNKWDAIAERTTPETDLRGQAWLARSRVIAAGARFDFVAAGRYAERAADLADQCGAVDVLFDAVANLVSCHHATGTLTEALRSVDRLFALADSQGNPRMRLVAAAHVAATIARAGNRARALEELEYARSQLANFGPTEERITALAKTHLDRDRGAWADAASGLLETIRLAGEEGHPLFTLEYRIELARIHLQIGKTLTPNEHARLRADARSSDAPLMTSYIDALFDQGEIQADAGSAVSAPDERACLEEIAIRADTDALRTEFAGGDPREPWAAARSLWQRLGCTVWLARAQARCGDLEAARHTLDLLDSPAEARAWALGEAAS